MNMLSDEFDDVLAGTSGHLGHRTLSSSSGGTFNNLNESDDEFDPTSLLSEPLFDDGDDDDNGAAALSLDLDEVPGLPSDPNGGDDGNGGGGGGSDNNVRPNKYTSHGGGGGAGQGGMVGGVYNDLPTPNDLNNQQKLQFMYQQLAMQGGGGSDHMSSSMMMGNQQQQFNSGQNSNTSMDNYQGMQQHMQGVNQRQMLNGDQMQQQMMNNQMNPMNSYQDLQQQQYGGDSSFNQQNHQNMGGMDPNAMHDQQQLVNRRMLEVQQKIQRVQQQIHNVQIGNPGSGGNVMADNMNPQHMQGGILHDRSMHLHQGMQGPFAGIPNDVTSMNNSMNSSMNNNSINMNSSGRMVTNSPPGRLPNGPGGLQNRSPPGRSVSMMSPSQQRTSQFSNSFLVQQQQQRQSALQAMSRSLNAHQSQQRHGHGPSSGSIDSSTRSVPGDLRSMQLAMMNRANMNGNGGLDQLPFSDNDDDSAVLMQSSSFHGPGGQQMRNNSLGSSSLHGGNVGPAMGGGGFDLAAMALSIQAGASAGGADGQPANVNEAMEKLCESMRRSAMSRSLVKQLSGRTLQRSHSGRGVARSNSARMAPVRSNSGRQLSRANSGKSIQRTHSGMQSMLVQSSSAAAGVVTPGMDSSVGSVGSKGNEMAARRLSGMSISQNSRNRMTPTRGVFRHHSSTAAMGNNRMSSLAAMQQVQMMQQQQISQSMDPNNFQMDPDIMQQQFQQQHMNNMMDNPNDFMSGGAY